jgi:hypothetical protein
MISMKCVSSGKSENMKKLQLIFFPIPLEKKDLELNVSSEIAEMTKVTQKEDTNMGSRYIQSVKRQKFGS